MTKVDCVAAHGVGFPGERRLLRTGRVTESLLLPAAPSAMPVAGERLRLAWPPKERHDDIQTRVALARLYPAGGIATAPSPTGLPDASSTVNVTILEPFSSPHAIASCRAWLIARSPPRIPGTILVSVTLLFEVVSFRKWGMVISWPSSWTFPGKPETPLR